MPRGNRSRGKGQPKKEQVTGTFEETVNNLLAKGEIYWDAAKYITNMASLPKFVLGADDYVGLKDALMRMVRQVRNQRNQCKEQNKQNRYVEWLKRASATLNSLDILPRDWISWNIFRLPPIRKTPEQKEYDPMAGRRDYRLHSSTLTASQETEVKSTVSSAASPVVSLSPDVLQGRKDESEDSVEEIDEQQEALLLAEDKGVTEPEAMDTEPSQDSRDLSMLTASALVPTEVTAVHPLATTQPDQCPPMRESHISPIRPPGSKKSSTKTAKLSVTKHVPHSDGACSTPVVKRLPRLTMVSSTDTNRRIVKVTPDEVSSSQPLRKKRLQPLTISTTFQKKARVEEVLSQARGAKQSRTFGKKCFVPSCTKTSSYLKHHAFIEHVPSVFDERLPFDDDRVLKDRRSALEQAARWLLRRPATVQDLLSFVSIQNILTCAENNTISEAQVRAMTEMCAFLRVEVPEKFTFVPANSPAILIHWKVLLLIAALLQPEEQRYWLDNFQGPEGLEVLPSLPEPPAEVLPEAFDSHFHLDRSLNSLKVETFEEILQRVPVDHDKRVKLIGTTAVFCDPRTYPSSSDLQHLPDNMFVVVGYHPSHARDQGRTRRSNIESLTRLLRHPRVVGLGEIGIDHARPAFQWHLQMELISSILPLLEDRHVLVLHCRGMDNDVDCGTEAFLLLLNLLRPSVSVNQSIHLHCFAGNQYVVDLWLQTFPRTYFGFTNMVGSFNTRQIEALRHIGEDRLLLESDAPYFRCMGADVASSPGQLYIVAMRVAEHRQLSVQRVLELTAANALHLYSGQFQ